MIIIYEKGQITIHFSETFANRRKGWATNYYHRVISS